MCAFFVFWYMWNLCGTALIPVEGMVRCVNRGKITLYTVAKISEIVLVDQLVSLGSRTKLVAKRRPSSHLTVHRDHRRSL